MTLLRESSLTYFSESMANINHFLQTKKQTESQTNRQGKNYVLIYPCGGHKTCFIHATHMIDW